MGKNRINSTNNTQIDPKNLIKKKKIVVPPFKQDREAYLKLIENKKVAMTSVKKKHMGFIRNMEIEEADINKYELADDDIDFLKKLFPDSFPSDIPNKELNKNPLVKKLEDMISFLEKSNNINELHTKFEDKNFTSALINKVIDYWKRKCRIVKRPLLRKNWKIINTNQLYGEVDVNKLAFKNREKKKRPQRNANRMGDEAVLKMLQKIKKEKEIALKVCQLILTREKLKFDDTHFLDTTKMEKEQWSSLSKKIEKHRKKSKRIIIQADEIIVSYDPPVETPAPTPVPVPAPKPPVVNNDYSYFTASLISDLTKYGFVFDDFKSENLSKKVNEKIKAINKKQSKVINDAKEKKIDLNRKSNIADMFDPKRQRIIKRASILDPTGFFIDKVKFERSNEEKDFYVSENFTFESLIKRDYSAFNENFSHCNLANDYSRNQYVYCGKSNINNTSGILERVKIKKYNKLLKHKYNFQDEIIYNSKKLAEDLEIQANKFLDNIKIEDKYKSFLKAVKK